jgi:carbamate kinase
MEYGEDERLTSKQPLTEFCLRSALGCRVTQQYDTTLLKTGCDVTVVAGVARTEGKEGQPCGTHTNKPINTTYHMHETKHTCASLTS